MGFILRQKGVPTFSRPPPSCPNASSAHSPHFYYGLGKTGPRRNSYANHRNFPGLGLPFHGAPHCAFPCTGAMGIVRSASFRGTFLAEASSFFKVRLIASRCLCKFARNPRSLVAECVFRAMRRGYLLCGIVSPCFFFFFIEHKVLTCTNQPPLLWASLCGDGGARSIGCKTRKGRTWQLELVF